MDTLLGIMGSSTPDVNNKASDSGRGVELLLTCEEDEGSSIGILPKLYYNSTADCSGGVAPSKQQSGLVVVCRAKSRAETDSFGDRQEISDLDSNYGGKIIFLCAWGRRESE
jgi:hypothetical protein